MWASDSGSSAQTRIRTPWSSGLPGAISNVDPAFTPGTAANHIGHGHVWKLGKRWKLDSIVRLWRQRFLAVKEGYAYFYRDERDWKEGKEAMKVANLEGAKIEVNPTKQNANRWIFSVSESQSDRCVVLAVLSEKQRDAWVAILQSAADPGRFSSKSRGVASRLETTPEIPLFEGESVGIEMSKRQLANEFATKDVVNRSPVAAQRSPTTVNESDEEDEGGGRGVFGRAGSAPKRVAGRERNFSDEIPFQASPVVSEVNKEELTISQVNRSGVSVDDSWADLTTAARAISAEDNREDDVASTETETLARFAQRWKEEAERMTELAQEAMRAKEIAEEEMEAMRAELEASKNLSKEDDGERDDGDMDQLVAFLRMEIDSRDEELAAAKDELQSIREGVERQIEEAIGARISRQDNEVQADPMLDRSIGSVGWDEEPSIVSMEPKREAQEISVSPLQGTVAKVMEDAEEATEDFDDEVENSESTQSSSTTGVRTTVRQAMLSPNTVWMLSWACGGWFDKHTSVRYRTERRGFQAFRDQVAGRKRRAMEVEVTALRTAMAGMRKASSMAGSILQTEDVGVGKSPEESDRGPDSPLPPPPPAEMSIREHQIRLEMEDVIQGLRDDLNDERAGAEKDRARHRAEMQKMSVLVQNTQRAKVETEKALGALRQEVARARDSYLEKEQRLLADAERMILEATKKATNGLILQTEQRLRASEMERQQLQLECQRLQKEAARAWEEARQHILSIDSELGGSRNSIKHSDDNSRLVNKSEAANGRVCADAEAGAKEDWHVWDEV